MVGGAVVIFCRLFVCGDADAVAGLPTLATRGGLVVVDVAVLVGCELPTPSSPLNDESFASSESSSIDDSLLAASTAIGIKVVRAMDVEVGGRVFAKGD